MYKSEYDSTKDYKYVKIPYKRSEETNIKLSKILKGRKQSKEHKLNLAKVQGKEVCKFSVNEELIEKYISIGDLSRKININKRSLSRYIKNQTPLKRYIYKFSEDIV